MVEWEVIDPPKPPEPIAVLSDEARESWGRMHAWMVGAMAGFIRRALDEGHAQEDLCIQWGQLLFDETLVARGRVLARAWLEQDGHTLAPRAVWFTEEGEHEDDK